jgi:hypothetical protein
MLTLEDDESFERLIGTVFQLPSPDSIYSRDEEIQKSVCSYPALAGLAHGARRTAIQPTWSWQQEC